jgi:hypothetical protein
MRIYDESLRIYWDNYSVIETAGREGRQQGKSSISNAPLLRTPRAGPPAVKSKQAGGNHFHPTRACL